MERSLRAKIGLTLLLFTALLSVPAFAYTEPKPSYDNPPCKLMPDPPPKGFKKWSDAQTWGPKVGGIPGVTKSLQWSNLTIECGQAVILDVPTVKLGLLVVRGWLKVLDSPSLPSISLSAHFIVVQGRFSIGTKLKQFSQLVTITLTPNPNKRAHLFFASNSDPNTVDPRELGHKAFAVVGGQVDFHGMPGSKDTPTWVKLTDTANAGDIWVTVDKDVSDWPIGSKIVIASTDYDPNQAETVTIVAIAPGDKGTYQIFIDSPLQFMHFGKKVSDGFGGLVDQQAEVALLKRNIQISGVDEPPPYQYEGGHFMIYFTLTPQYIEGVEFFLMGQQGNLGRYNIHFHVCGNQHGVSVVRKNLMHNSKQRCVVVHATFNLTVEENVAYNTSGHCYIVEEGGETGNTFIRNLGILTRRVDKLIFKPGFNQSEESDDRPSTFWISNPNNNYVGNVAAGGDDTGFWMELRDSVRGLSALWPFLNHTIPKSVHPAGHFEGNTAHSVPTGFRTYPFGYNPRINATTDNPNYFWNGFAYSVIGGFNVYKNLYDGIFIHNSDYIILENMTVSDCFLGIELNRESGIIVRNSRLIGRTNNYGNPGDCTNPNNNRCAPVKGCKFPLQPGEPGRNTLWQGRNFPVLGIYQTQQMGFDFGRSSSNSVQNVTFYNFDDSCSLSAGMAIGSGQQYYWNSGTNARKVRFKASNEAFFFPRSYSWPGRIVPQDGGEVSTTYALRDMDGSLMSRAGIKGATSGYLVSKEWLMKPPTSANCVMRKAWSAYACPNACFRTLFVEYKESGFAGNTDGTPRDHGSYSYLRLTRLMDGQVLTLDGNLNDPTLDYDEQRQYQALLYAGAAYELEIVAPDSQQLAGKPEVFLQPQDGLTLYYRDGGGCGKGITLKLKVGKKPWFVEDSEFVWRSPCSGTANNASLVAYSVVCDKNKGRQELLLVIGASYPAQLQVLLSNNTTLPCSKSSACGLFPSGYSWKYQSTVRFLYPDKPGHPGFMDPIYPPEKTWPVGVAPFGYWPWGWSAIETRLPPSPPGQNYIYYFRTSFTVRDSSCFSSLLLDLVVDDSVVLFLNGHELLRSNLPMGDMEAYTRPLSSLDVYTSSGPYFSSFSVPLGTTGGPSLVEGVNYVSAEVRMAGYAMTFDMRLGAIRKSDSCKGRVKTPEVCDGLDNDGDGTIDIDPKTSKPFVRDCSTPCGKGKETCTQGAFNNCPAKAPKSETCNGKDDNCDGMIDNIPLVFLSDENPLISSGSIDMSRRPFYSPLNLSPSATCNSQLKAPPNVNTSAKNFNSVCAAAHCASFLSVSSKKSVWGKNATGWRYYDKGADIPKFFPNWGKGVTVFALWGSGPAPLGYFNPDPKMKFGTILNPPKGAVISYYFLKSFNLTQSEVDSTYAIRTSVRRADGVVVYLNGHEIFRSNLPSGPISPTTAASNFVNDNDNPNVDDIYDYYDSTATPNTATFLNVGTNWIAAEVHQVPNSHKLIFDLSLDRLTKASCAPPPKTKNRRRILSLVPHSTLSSSSSSSSTCVIAAPFNTTILPVSSNWSYVDAKSPLPPYNWMNADFDSSKWKHGQGPLGSQAFWWANTKLNLNDKSSARKAYYFRTSFTLYAANCYFRLKLRLVANDGAVVYLNGAEVLRHQMPAVGVINANTTAVWDGDWNYLNYDLLSSGWLNPAGSMKKKNVYTNVVAVELHQASFTTDYWIFDLGIEGIRDANCDPPPL